MEYPIPNKIPNEIPNFDKVDADSTRKKRIR